MQNFSPFDRKFIFPRLHETICLLLWNSVSFFEDRFALAMKLLRIPQFNSNFMSSAEFMPSPTTARFESHLKLFLSFLIYRASEKPFASAKLDRSIISPHNIYQLSVFPSRPLVISSFPSDKGRQLLLSSLKIYLIDLSFSLTLSLSLSNRKN